MFTFYILFNVGANPLVAESVAKGKRTYCKYQAAAKLTCFGKTGAHSTKDSRFRS
jgi:hypothetical protein